MLVALVIIPITLVFRGTLYGVYQLRIARWEEEKFVGKPVKDLEQALKDRGGRLQRVENSRLYYLTGEDAWRSQRLYRFVKGKPYRWWFLIGTVTNLGYVLTEVKEGEETVVRLVRGRSVDSL